MRTLLLLSLLLSTTFASADELTLMFIRSPEISWTSPRALAKSTVSSIDSKYGLGHVNIRIACQGQKTVHTGIYNRFTNQTTDAVRKNGQGLGVLFNLFEGLLQKPGTVAPTFEKLTKRGRTNFITFKISRNTCQRLLTYHNQYWQIYKQRTKLPRARGQKPDHTQQIFYGFQAIPRYGEGGGCSAFAVSFLEVAGLKEEWMLKEWTQNLRVPVAAVGMPMTSQHISLADMLFSSPLRWASPTEPHFPLFFWDPDKMFEHTNARLNSRQYREEMLYGSRGYSIDRSYLPTPTEPIFLNDPFEQPSDPREFYSDMDELGRRYELSRELSGI